MSEKEEIRRKLAEVDELRARVKELERMPQAVWYRHVSKHPWMNALHMLIMISAVIIAVISRDPSVFVIMVLIVVYLSFKFFRPLFED